jgi:microcystin-dependent protein
MQVGSIIIYPSESIPDGFLVCDGTAVSRDQYSDLFEVIGTTYGSGDGVSTFNLPNLVNRVGVGQSVSYLIGSHGGDEEIQLSTTEIASHSHDLPQHAHSVSAAMKTPELSHSITQPNFTYQHLNGKAVRGSSGTRTTTMITGTSTQTMSRSTNVGVSNHDATACTISGGVMDCPAFDTESAGIGDAHENMMPYLAVMYIIRYEPESKAERMLIFNGCMPVAPSGTYLKGKKR